MVNPTVQLVIDLLAKSGQKDLWGFVPCSKCGNNTIFFFTKEAALKPAICEECNPPLNICWPHSGPCLGRWAHVLAAKFFRWLFGIRGHNVAVLDVLLTITAPRSERRLQWTVTTRRRREP